MAKFLRKRNRIVSVARRPVREVCLPRLIAGWLSLLIIAAFPAQSARAEKPPRGLVREIARNGSLFTEEREHYTYRQKFTFYELDKHGAAVGSYREVRDILFSPKGERGEEFVGRPLMNLKRLRLTEEDFRDLREVQPFVLTEDSLWNYEVIYKGTEPVEGEDCYVYRLRPRQVLEGQRLLDGLIWVSREHRQLVRIAGQPVPQIHSTKEENLFPQFTTIYQPVDGKFWFPVKTYANDILPFGSGPQRVRYIIDYENYKRFTAESTVTYEAAPPKP